MLLNHIFYLTFKYFIQLTTSFKTPEGPKTCKSFCKNRCLKPSSTSTGKLFEVGFSEIEVHLSIWANILETCYKFVIKLKFINSLTSLLNWNIFILGFDLRDLQIFSLTFISSFSILQNYFPFFCLPNIPVMGPIFFFL